MRVAVTVAGDRIRFDFSGTGDQVAGARNMTMLAVLCYELIEDSGGAGEHRGGLGTRRDIMALGDDCRLSGRMGTGDTMRAEFCQPRRNGEPRRWVTPS